jgi:RNA polymerase sigma factor (sigma-70 family)
MSPRISDLFLSSQSDERLVNLARQGHERAFVAIVERYRPELAAFARRLAPDGRSEDAVQQALLSAFAALRSGCEVNHLRGWLYQIVRNASARERSPLFAPLDSATASAETLEDIVQQRALALAALSELGRLPHRQRQAMVGTLGGLARSEVASSMGLSEGAVRQLVHRARSSLRSAVTAITPWPLARWLVTLRPGGRGAAQLSAGVGTPGAAELAAGAGAVSSGGVAIKLGVVLASGTLATGIAAVDLHAGRSHRPAARASTVTHTRSMTHGGGGVTFAAEIPSPSTGTGAGSGARPAGTVVPVSLPPADAAAGSSRSDGRGGVAAGGAGGSGGGRGGAPSQPGRHGPGSGGQDGGGSGPTDSGSGGSSGQSGSGSDGGSGRGGSGSGGGSGNVGSGTGGGDSDARHGGGGGEAASATSASAGGSGSDHSHNDQSPGAPGSDSSGDGAGYGGSAGSASATSASTSTPASTPSASSTPVSTPVLTPAPTPAPASSSPSAPASGSD